jgi:hypothetical protein
MSLRKASRPSRRIWRGAGFFVACAYAWGAGGGCGPSLDPAAKADIDQRSARIPKPSQTFPAPAEARALPLAAGQWTQYRAADDKGRPSFLTYKLIDEELGSWWLEIVNESYFGRTVTRLLVYLGDRQSLDVLDIKAMKLRDKDGNVTDAPPETLAMAKSLWGGLLSPLVIHWDGAAQEDVTAPAGSFAGAYKAHTPADWGPFKSESDAWSHPAVPLTGLVRSQGKDKPTRLELVAFGEKGARSEF